MKLRNTLIDRIVDAIPFWLYRSAVNIRCTVRGKAHRLRSVRYPQQGEIYCVHDADDSIYLCRRGRHNMHKYGIMRRAYALAEAYCITQLPPLRGGTLIDCGANIGELGLWARRQGVRYIAIEPESLEAYCCDLNNFSGQNSTIRKALWKRDETLKFYHRAASADSSLLINGDDDSFIEMPAVRLDSILSSTQICRPAVLKIEAEGAEPEVLEGSAGLLAYIDFVAVDCGYERGPKENPAPTFIESNRILHEAGFSIMFANLRRGAFLYGREV